MIEIVLLAKSSSRDEPYEVTFTQAEDGILSIWCSCRAGEFGQLCKHKLAFASNDQSMLHDKNQLTELEKVNNWVQMYGYSEQIRKLKEMENELEILKKRIKTAKAKIAKSMKDGL